MKFFLCLIIMFGFVLAGSVNGANIVASNVPFDIPGRAYLFFQGVSQNIQLWFTVNDTNDAQKRLLFATQNIELATKIINATTDAHLQVRAEMLIRRVNNFVAVVNSKQDEWSQGKPEAVASVINTSKIYYETVRNLLDDIGRNAAPEIKNNLDELMTILTNENKQLIDFINSEFPDQSANLELIEDLSLPVAEDKDRDGLPDTAEKDLGIGTDDFDTDGDSLSDRAEIEKYGTDPTLSDSDKDGFNDGFEILKGYNPSGAGSLADNVPQPQESAFFKKIQNNTTLNPNTQQYIKNLVIKINNSIPTKTIITPQPTKNIIIPQPINTLTR